MQETLVRSLGQEDLLKKQMATPVFLPRKSHGHRSLAGYSPGVARVGCDLVTKPPHNYYYSFPHGFYPGVCIVYCA